jgi:hypothetical protein
MSQVISGIMQTKTLTRLDTYNYTAETTSLYTVGIRLTEVPPSGLIITIQQNSSTIVQSVAPASSQQVINLRTLLNCTSGDIISIILASSNSNDATLNNIKGTLQITPGIYQM